MSTYLSRASARQVEANRRNAQRSTGPRTDVGRASSSQNSTRHGLCARVVPGVNPALPGEDAEAYLAFAAAMRRDFSPTGEVEEILAERAAQLAWKLRRVPVAEAAAADVLIEKARLKHEAEQRVRYGRKSSPFVAPPAMELVGASVATTSECAFERLQIYEQRIERQFHGCLQQLRLLRKMRRDQGELSEYSRSADLGVEEAGPQAGTNLRERPSDGPQRTSGVSSFGVSSSSVFATQKSKEGGDEGTGEAPVVRGCASEKGAGEAPVVRVCARKKTRARRPRYGGARLKWAKLLVADLKIWRNERSQIPANFWQTGELDQPYAPVTEAVFNSCRRWRSGRDAG